MTINGLAIEDFDGGLVEHFRDSVIGGPGAFVLAANGFDDFARAVAKKLLQELNVSVLEKRRSSDQDHEFARSPSSRP